MECFQTRRNRTLDRHIFLSRKQKPTETLHQFWNVLNGLAARCDFGNQTVGLVHEIFVLNKNNKHVQEKLCSEPKENPAEALQFAIAFEDSLKRQKSYGYISQEPKIKEEPICVVSTSQQRECWRCRAGNFTLDHLSKCKAPNAMCNYCGRKGHVERVCNQKKKDTNTKFGNSRGNGNTARSGNRVQRVDPEEIDEDDEDDYMVLKVEADKDQTKPYYMEGFINGNRFKAMIDTGSPVTIFALDEVKRIMKRNELQVRPMIENERYVDFSGRPLKLMGYVFCELQVNDSYVKKARILIAKPGTKSIIGREWLPTLRYKLVAEGELEVNSIENQVELSTEAKQFVKEFPKLFEDKGKKTSSANKLQNRCENNTTKREKNSHSATKGRR